jgi:hypothetical protein
MEAYVTRHAGTSWAGLFIIYMAASILSRLMSVGMATFTEQMETTVWLGAIEFFTRLTIKIKDLITTNLMVCTAPLFEVVAQIVISMNLSRLYCSAALGVALS